jgi:hypothetical protein
MEYTLLVPNWAPYDQDVMIELAVEAEKLGYQRIFYTDHLMNPYRATEGYAEETVEVWSLLAYLAAETTTIRLGTGVTPIALRPPALLAKQVATIDNLSGGRIDFGLGTGWSEGSFGAIDTDFGDPASRKARLREGIDLILKLWQSDEPVAFTGDYYKSSGAVIGPQPVQRPHPPLWEPHRRVVCEAHVMDSRARRGTRSCRQNHLRHWADRAARGGRRRQHLTGALQAAGAHHEDDQRVVRPVRGRRV